MKAMGYTFATLYDDSHVGR